MEKNYITSKETAKYLDAVLILRQGADAALKAAEAVYGDTLSPTGEEIIKPFQTKINEAVDELFKLIQANMEINLGFTDNAAKENVTI